jgi:hypothetical protein
MATDIYTHISKEAAKLRSFNREQEQLCGAKLSAVSAQLVTINEKGAIREISLSSAHRCGDCNVLKIPSIPLLIRNRPSSSCLKRRDPTKPVMAGDRIGLGECCAVAGFLRILYQKKGTVQLRN